VKRTHPVTADFKDEEEATSQGMWVEVGKSQEKDFLLDLLERKVALPTT
jgi:hypothetical protein